MIEALVLSKDDRAVMDGPRKSLECADELVVGVAPGNDLGSAEDDVLEVMTRTLSSPAIFAVLGY